MKKFLKLTVVLTVLCIIGTFVILCACADKPERKLQSFKLGEVYGQFNKEPLYIEVTMSDEYRCNFTIEDKEQIDEIYSFVSEQVWYLYEQETIPPGSNKSVKFVFNDDSCFSIGTRSLIYRGETYLMTNSMELDIMLEEIGREKGVIS